MKVLIRSCLNFKIQLNFFYLILNCLNFPKLERIKLKSTPENVEDFFAFAAAKAKRNNNNHKRSQFA